MLSKILGTQRPQSVSSKGGVGLHTSSGNLVRSCWGSMEFTRRLPPCRGIVAQLTLHPAVAESKAEPMETETGPGEVWVIRLSPSPAVSANKGSFRWAAALHPVISSASA